MNEKIINRCYRTGDSVVNTLYTERLQRLPKPTVEMPVRLPNNVSIDRINSESQKDVTRLDYFLG